MIKLDKHIEILLLDNDCVIVPGFGGFVSHRIDAQWDESDNMFLPPRRTLGFNNQLTLNDSLLVQSYVEAYDMSYPEAQKEIEEEVAGLRHEIDFKGFFDLHGLGTMRRNAEGKYTFSPNECGILTPQLYGLSGVEISPLAKNRNIGPTDKGTSSDSPKAISIKLNTLRKIAAACILALVFWMLPSPILDKGSATLKGGFNTDMLYKIMPKSMTIGKPDLKAANANSHKQDSKDKTEKTEIVDKTNATKSPAPKENQSAAKRLEGNKNATVQKGQWTIVLACMLPQANAEQYMNTLSQQGIANVYVEISGKNSKVLCGKFNSREEASTALRRLQVNKPGMAGWITNIE